MRAESSRSTLPHRGRGPRAAALAALLMPLGGAATGAGLPGDWVEARSAHFAVVGNVQQERALEIAREFERIHALLSEVAPPPEEVAAPLPVFVARDAATMKLLMPSVVAARGRGVVGGRFVEVPTHRFVQLLATGDPESLTIVFHEYFHHFTRQHGVRLPLWVEEGLADFWGATRIEGDVARVGSIPMGRPYALDSRSLLPVERLLAVDRSSREYLDRIRSGRFYAESWALVHYLIVGDLEHKRADQLSRYLKLTSEGRDPVAAGREAFGDLDALEKELKAYVRKGRYPNAVRKAPPVPGAASVSSRPLAEADAAAEIALALMHSEPAATARPLVELALAGAPESVAARVSAGMLALAENRAQDALPEFERAASSPAATAIAFYGRAVTRLMRDRSPDSFAAAEQDLNRAKQLDGRMAAPHSRLAEVRLARGGTPAEALAHIRRARDLQPDDWYYRLREIELRELTGDAASARAEIAHVVEEALASEDSVALNNQCWFGSLVGYAREFLPLCERSVQLRGQEASSLDSRGVARALSGDLAGAAKDLRAALAAASNDWSEPLREARRRWIAELEAGRNPLDAAAARALLDSPEESGGWGR